MFEAPEKKFQKHIADYLIREHKYPMLTQEEITDTEHYFAEDHLYAFLKATQAETLERLEEDYGTDTRDEIFKAASVIMPEKGFASLKDNQSHPPLVKPAQAGRDLLVCE